MRKLDILSYGEWRTHRFWMNKLVVLNHSQSDFLFEMPLVNEAGIPSPKAGKGHNEAAVDIGMKIDTQTCMLGNAKDDIEGNQSQVPQQDNFDYSQRAQWLRAAVLGANDGLVSVASLMMGIGAVKKDVRVMIITGFAGLIAGACSMAIGEFVSVYSQLDIEVAQMTREKNMMAKEENEEKAEKEQLPNPIQAALASALAFSLGAIVPLLAAAFIGDHKVRLAVVIAAVTLALVVFGGVGAVLGGTPVVKSSSRVLIGGWMAMAITFGLTKLIGSSGL